MLIPHTTSRPFPRRHGAVFFPLRQCQFPPRDIHWLSHSTATGEMQNRAGRTQQTCSYREDSCINLINLLHFIQSEGPSNVRLPRSYMHGDNQAEVFRKSSQEEQEGVKELYLKHHDDEQKAIQIPNNTHQLFHPGLQAPCPAVLVISSSPSSPLLYSLHAPRELGTNGDT